MFCLTRGIKRQKGNASTISWELWQHKNMIGDGSCREQNERSCFVAPLDCVIVIHLTVVHQNRCYSAGDTAKLWGFQASFRLLSSCSSSNTVKGQDVETWAARVLSRWELTLLDWSLHIPKCRKQFGPWKTAYSNHHSDINSSSHWEGMPPFVKDARWKYLTAERKLYAIILPHKEI